MNKNTIAHQIMWDAFHDELEKIALEQGMEKEAFFGLLAKGMKSGSPLIRKASTAAFNPALKATQTATKLITPTGLDMGAAAHMAGGALKRNATSVSAGRYAGRNLITGQGGKLIGGSPMQNLAHRVGGLTQTFSPLGGLL